MGNLARTIVVSGYYGFNNSGDEAVLHAIATALRDEAKALGAPAPRIVVLSGDPAETARLHGVEAAHRMRPLAVLGALRRADALISGGGSLLQDVTSAKSVFYYLAVLRLARWLRVPTFIYAQGVGPIRDRARFGPMIRSAFEKSRFISVRDEESKALVASFGVAAERVNVVPDPVMGMGLSLAPLGSGEGASPRIGVSVRFWREDRSELARIAAALRSVLEGRPDAKVSLLPFHLQSDKLASEFIADRLRAAGYGPDRVELHGGAAHPSDMLREVARCDLLVGMRLHSLIYAATAGVPPVAVSYDPKIDQFMRRLGEAPVGDTDSLDADALASTVLGRLELGKNAWYEEKRAAIEEMQQTSRAPAQQIFRELRI